MLALVVQFPVDNFYLGHLDQLGRRQGPEGNGGDAMGGHVWPHNFLHRLLSPGKRIPGGKDDFQPRFGLFGPGKSGKVRGRSPRKTPGQARDWAASWDTV